MDEQQDPNPQTTTRSAAPTGHIAAEQQIGPYRILGMLGEGGMGVVYLAEQTEPVKRRVALKIIKLGMDTKQVIARFESERQALAMMDHPNVAKVLDAGATDQGRPYFVMEQVAGVPITEHCDRQRLSIDERLGLFMQVCAAVQHAHQKGIIHRDLKPSNILVTADGTSIPKVIDFGVAKATAHKLTERTLFTEQGQLVGTPAYMSPEQAEMTAQDVDTRSDIYSLGVLLYELLTGTLPFDPKAMRRGGLGEIQRIIREQEPSRPSTKLTSLASPNKPTGSGESHDAANSTLDAIAHHRRTEMRTLLRDLRGDLDWIVMKCLEKDRARRYVTASALADDIIRHLGSEPVLASPPSLVYRLRKFARRNRVGLISTAIVAAVLLVSTTVSVVFALSEFEQRRIAKAAREREQRTSEENRELRQAIDELEEESGRRDRP